MLQANKHKTAMSSSPLPGSRPWTPPDSEADAQMRWGSKHGAAQAEPEAVSDSGYFGDSCNSMCAPSEPAPTRWSLPASHATDLLRPLSPAPSRDHLGDESSAHGLGLIQRPYTPTPSHSSSNAPRYPYTPDSARTSTKRSPSYPESPLLPSMAWESSPPLIAGLKGHTSPVQNALFSCLNNLERLISTKEPEADQMEYIIEQFEAMTSYLSAPESQSKLSDDHLFSDLDAVAGNTDPSTKLTKEDSIAYVAAVGDYITEVQQRTEDMRQRLHEVKQLNSINLTVIADLRRQVAEYEEAKARDPQPKKAQESRPKKAHNMAKQPEPRRNSIWASVIEALDQLGDMIFEW